MNLILERYRLGLRCTRVKLWAVFLPLVFFLPAAAEDHGFSFTGPKLGGWEEIQPKTVGAPEGVVFMTMSGDGSGNLNVILGNGKLAVTEPLMAQLRDKMVEQLASAGVTGAQVLDATIVDVAGVPGLRMVTRGVYAGTPKSQLIYILPGKKQYATLTYTSSQEDFDARLSAFDESAKQTRGLVKHMSTEKYVLYGAIAGGIITVLFSLYKKMTGE